MYKRLELHNHTTESDASISPLELIEFMYTDNVDGFAITDHNTISGHRIIKELLEKLDLDISCIYGMEYTTYYGHILCLNLNEYVPWENINMHKPELLFEAIKSKGSLVGIAHPFSYGHPFARGCRFDMKISDFTSVDFIEIFNNPEPLKEVNERGLLWWEDLVLQGNKLAFTAGMDLHGKWDMKNNYGTFIEGEPDGNIENELNVAIKNQKTWISKGPVLKETISKDRTSVTFSIVNTNKKGFLHDDSQPYYLNLRTKDMQLTKQITVGSPLTVGIRELNHPDIVIPKLYNTNTSIENLVAVAPVITLI